MILFGNYQLSIIKPGWETIEATGTLSPSPATRLWPPTWSSMMVIMTKILIMARIVIISKMAMAMDNGHGGPHWIIL